LIKGNPLSFCTKFREELRFKVCCGFPLANSFGKKKQNTKKTKEKKENNTKSVGRVGDCKIFDFQLFVSSIGGVFC